MAAPLLTIPFLTGQDALDECLASLSGVDVLIIDNSEAGYHGAEWPWVLPMPSNIGVAASWNLAIRSRPQDPFWLIANHDTVFAPGDLERLSAEMERPGPRWVGINGDWRVFGINAACVETVGWFDENFHPIYCEDCDYEYRCNLLGVPWYFIDGGTTHVRSASIREPRYAAANARTYPDNREHYRRKWGGEPRGGERFTTPFDSGAPVAAWTLDLARLRANDWHRDG